VRPVAIVGAAALSGRGSDPIDDAPLANPKTQKMMSRGAYLAARCLHDLLAKLDWADRAAVGYYLGVGASGGSLDDVTALLDASIADHEFSVARFGDRGLAACNPMLAFQLMNNFTMAHGAILEGLGGPNGALFSRGAGTTAALVEAVHAVASGDCDRAIAGGADSATHPVTRAELARDGFVARGLVPAEGAALVALAAADGPGVIVEHASIANGEVPPDLDVEVDAVVIAPWGPPAGDVLAAWARDRYRDAKVVDVSRTLGDALAASHALAWVAALELLDTMPSAMIVGAGTDGDTGTVVLRRRSA